MVRRPRARSVTITTRPALAMRIDFSVRERTQGPIATDLSVEQRCGNVPCSQPDLGVMDPAFARTHDMGCSLKTTTPARHRRRRSRFARCGLLRGLRLFRRPLLFRVRQQQLRVVIDDAIDARGNFVPGELAFARSAQQRHDIFSVVGPAVEPALDSSGAIVTGTR